MGKDGSPVHTSGFGTVEEGTELGLLYRTRDEDGDYGVGEFVEVEVEGRGEKRGSDWIAHTEEGQEFQLSHSSHEINHKGANSAHKLSSTGASPRFNSDGPYEMSSYQLAATYNFDEATGEVSREQALRELKKELSKHTVQQVGEVLEEVEGTET